jgi:hypothetical protein
MFGGGALVMAVLLVVLGAVMLNRADFSRNYVHDQLVQESVVFPVAKDLQPREKSFTEARSGCVLTYAGQEVTTGKQAECYANEYLGGHLSWLATRLGMTQVAYVDGKNYRELGLELANIRAQIKTAEQSGSPDVAALQQKLTDVTTVRQKMFEGTMLRNALLTSYGFGELGTLARTGSNVCFAIGGLLVLLAIASFAHAARTPKSQAFAPPLPIQPAPRELAHV